MPKCYICKKELKKEEAYMFIYTSKSGKEYRRYACSLEEIENDKRDKELYKKIQLLTDEILGYPCVNNLRNKKIGELINAGFNNEQIFRCFKQYKEEIIKLININKIDKEYNKIVYMFTVVGNCIYDFAREDAKKDWAKQGVEENENYEEIEETNEDIVQRIRGNKKEKENSISSFLNGLK